MNKLGFGTMRLPLPNPKFRDQVDMKELCSMVDIFLDRGFTYFDTAYLYHGGQCECAVRDALVKRYPREKFLLADKMPMMCLNKNSTQKDHLCIFDEQLKKCGVDYFDYYLLHNINEHEYRKAQQADSFGFLRQMKDRGRIGQLGFSFHDKAELLDRILENHPEVDFVQLQLNYLDWEDNRIQSQKCYETAVKHNKPVIVMEPVKGGNLAQVPRQVQALFASAHPDWSPASWAIRFAASLENVKVVLSGMSSLEQILDNTSYMRKMEPLTSADYTVLRQATEIICTFPTIACTSCRYCVDDCPRNIPIPDYFALFNREQNILRQGGSADKSAYQHIAEGHGLAADCLACHQCEGICPQHLPITRWLRQISAIYEKD